MHLAAKEVFLDAVRRLKLSRSSSAVIGLSGGADSVALMFLARQYFRRVVAVTVDHRLREESREEAEHAGKLAQSLGVHHTIRELEWGSQQRTGSRARVLRYSTLMKECERLDADMLLVGHHCDDQIETLLMRLMMGSGILGLAGMQSVSFLAASYNFPVIRPLLNTTKSSLVELCEEKGLEWVEDPSNQLPISPRNRLRNILSRHPQLSGDLGEILTTCQEVRDGSHELVREAMEELVNVNMKYGTISFDGQSYRLLNPYIARSVLSIWLRYVNGSSGSINRYSLEKLHQIIVKNKTTADTHNKCILIPLPKQKRFMIAKQKPMSLMVMRNRMPIRIGQTVIWDNRFEISLFEKSNAIKGDRENLESQTFYIRHFVGTDNDYLHCGVRKIKHRTLIHRHARGGLPVIIDDKGRVVLIPHFRVINHLVGVDCKVTFVPQWSMNKLLNFHSVSSGSSINPT